MAKKRKWGHLAPRVPSFPRCARAKQPQRWRPSCVLKKSLSHRQEQTPHTLRNQLDMFSGSQTIRMSLGDKKPAPIRLWWPGVGELVPGSPCKMRSFSTRRLGSLGSMRHVAHRAQCGSPSAEFPLWRSDVQGGAELRGNWRQIPNPPFVRGAIPSGSAFPPPAPAPPPRRATRAAGDLGLAKGNPPLGLVAPVGNWILDLLSI